MAMSRAGREPLTKATEFWEINVLKVKMLLSPKGYQRLEDHVTHFQNKNLEHFHAVKSHCIVNSAITQCAVGSLAAKAEKG